MVQPYKEKCKKILIVNMNAQLFNIPTPIFTGLNKKVCFLIENLQ